VRESEREREREKFLEEIMPLKHQIFLKDTLKWFWRGNIVVT
jgi:hypothetical protein